MESYKTVRAFAEAEYTDRRSRFVAAVMPVSGEKQALDFISERKSASYGARHNVYAYVLRENGITRYSDDGEPHSTAGMPTLDVLRRADIVDCCIVTTRYFGGVLLGTGGLVRAYTEAAKAAVGAAGVAVMKECFICRAACEYPDHKNVCETISSCGGVITGTVFTESVGIDFRVAADGYEYLCRTVNERTNGRIAPEIVGNGFAEV